MSVPPDRELPAVTPVRTAHGGRRRALVGAAVVVALVAVAIVKPWQGPVTSAAVAEPPSPQPASSPPVVPVTPPAATLPADPMPSPTQNAAGALAARPWLLDFTRSGIKSRVCLDQAGKRCLSGELASDLQFRAANVSGGTGLGGGCDEFAGTFRVDAPSLRILVPTYPSRCFDTGTDLLIRVRLDHVARFVVASDTLILLDAAGKVLLVYRR